MKIIVLILNSLLLGVGLAMDAFSVSVANGLHNPKMKQSERFRIAGCFAVFQGGMPLIGWVCVRLLDQFFDNVQKVVPWVACVVLMAIAAEMIVQGIRNKKDSNDAGREDEKEILEVDGRVSWKRLLLQGLATSLDALSVGFVIAGYGISSAVISVIIIAVVTLLMCLCGLGIGRKAGKLMNGGADILGGIILIAVGLEILLSALL